MVQVLEQRFPRGAGTHPRVTWACCPRVPGSGGPCGPVSLTHSVPMSLGVPLSQMLMSPGPCAHVLCPGVPSPCV